MCGVISGRWAGRARQFFSARIPFTPLTFSIRSAARRNCCGRPRCRVSHPFHCSSLSVSSPRSISCISRQAS
ncbi:MAG: hypothetical protein DCC52_05155 [Chloroflexi bacterium]|nr:MAG: hypothetical protein DCC52_05155 [Chloroflexota bacterium]